MVIMLTASWKLVAFGSNRGLFDAANTLQSIICKCHRYTQPLYGAFVDLCKAYDSIPEMHVLSVYGVESNAVHTEQCSLVMPLVLVHYNCTATTAGIDWSRVAFTKASCLAYLQLVLRHCCPITTLACQAAAGGGRGLQI